MNVFLILLASPSPCHPSRLGASLSQEAFADSRPRCSPSPALPRLLSASALDFLHAALSLRVSLGSQRGCFLYSVTGRIDAP